MNPRLLSLADEALDAARRGDADDESVSLLLALLRRYRARANSAVAASDTELIATMYGEDAATIAVASPDVAALAARLLHDLGSLPPRSAVVANIAAAPEDEHFVPVVVAVLDQFDPPVKGADELSVTSLLSALSDHGADERAATTLARWSPDPGEAGDRAREALARPRYTGREWAWESVDDLVDDVVAAIPGGWADAPPVDALSLLLERERAALEHFGELDEMLAGYGPTLTALTIGHDGADDIARRLWRSAPDDLASIDPLARVIVAVGSEAVVPYLRELLHRNEGRHGCYAAVTEDAIRDALGGR